MPGTNPNMANEKSIGAGIVGTKRSPLRIKAYVERRENINDMMTAGESHIKRILFLNSCS